MTLRNKFNAKAFWDSLPNPANGEPRWYAKHKKEVTKNIAAGNITILDFLEKYPNTALGEVQEWIEKYNQYAQNPDDASPLRATRAQSYPTRKNDI